MPIEIKILNKKSCGEAPAGKYIARYLDERSLGPLQALNPCKNAQIIEGIHSGQIVPYDSYVVIGDLPAQADVIKHNEELTERLANAGITIKNLEKHVNERRESWDKERKALEKSLAEGGLMVGELKKENEKLRNGEYAINFAPHIGALKERNQQLEWELEALRNGKKVELPLEVAEAINTCRTTGLDDYQILSLQAVVNQLFRDYPEPVLNALESIRKFAVQQPSNAEILLSALANDYSVAPAPVEDKASELLAGVTTIVQKWWFEAPDGRTAKSHSDQLAKDICDYIKQREDDKPLF